MNATLTQFLSPQFGVFLGKINTLDSAITEFYGDYRTQFENAMFSFPMTLEQVPISTFGGGVIGIPREDILLSATVLGASGTPDSNDPGQAFDCVLVLGSGQLTVKPFGLLGHQSLNIEWNDKERLSLTQDPTNLTTLLLQSEFPRLANPGPALQGILAQFFPNLLAPARPPQQQQQQLGDELRLRPVFLAARRQPASRCGTVLCLRSVRREPQPDPVLFPNGDRR